MKSTGHSNSLHLHDLGHTRRPEPVRCEYFLNSSFIFHWLSDESVIRINIPYRRNISPIRYSDFTNVSHTFVPEKYVPLSATTSHKRNRIILMGLILKIITIFQTKLAFKLPRTSTAAARDISSIAIVISFRTTYSPIFLILFSLLSLCPDFSSSSFFSCDSNFSYLLLMTPTVSILLVCLLYEILLYACLLCTLKFSNVLLSKTDSIPNLCISSTM